MKTMSCPECNTMLEWEDHEDPAGGLCNDCVRAALPERPWVFEVIKGNAVTLVVSESIEAAVAAWRTYRKAMSDDWEDDDPEPQPDKVTKLKGRALTPAYLAIVEDAFKRRAPA